MTSRIEKGKKYSDGNERTEKRNRAYIHRLVFWKPFVRSCKRPYVGRGSVGTIRARIEIPSDLAETE